MPIYEYRCSSCGQQQEFLQKLSDAPVKRCTKCGQDTFSKMVTAAGFQLKGSGWYATDFRNSGSKPAAKVGAVESSKADAKSEVTSEAKTEAKAEAKSDAKPDSAKAAAPASVAGAGPATP